MLLMLPFDMTRFFVFAAAADDDELLPAPVPL